MQYHFRFSKKYMLKLLSVLFIATGSIYASLEYEMIYGEKGSNKIKLFFFAEGFDEAHKIDYKNTVKSFVDTLFSISPYKEYKNLFTVYRVWTPSLCSYVPSGQPSDSTFFGGSTSTNGPPAMSAKGMKYLLDINVGQKDTDFICPDFTWDQQSIVIFNSYLVGVRNPGITFSGSCFTLLYLEGGGRCLAHELGHQFGKLTDEYERLNYSGEAYESPNTTQKSNRDSIPWRFWISDTTPVPTPETDDYLNVIGLFEGAQYYSNGWYRPKMHCIMRGSGDSPFFCEVCRESITSYLLRRAMIDSVSPGINSTVTNGKLQIKSAQIDTFPIKFSWYFNDTLLEDTNCILDLSTFKKNGTIKAVVDGNSGFIRNPKYSAIVTLRWTFQYINASVKVSPVLVSNDKIRQIRNGVYYIPQTAYGKFYIFDMLGRNIPIHATEKEADHIVVDLNKYAAKGKYMIGYK